MEVLFLVQEDGVFRMSFVERLAVCSCSTEGRASLGNRGRGEDGQRRRWKEG